jgi:hypothetical protein
VLIGGSRPVWAIASALDPSNLSPTWATRPYLSDRCLQDSPVCSGQLTRVRKAISLGCSLEIELYSQSWIHATLQEQTPQSFLVLKNSQSIFHNRFFILTLNTFYNYVS